LIEFASSLFEDQKCLVEKVCLVCRFETALLDSTISEIITHEKKDHFSFSMLRFSISCGGKKKRVAPKKDRVAQKMEKKEGSIFFPSTYATFFSLCL
jgi:hypothetical protein